MHLKVRLVKRVSLQRKIETIVDEQQLHLVL
jgi:hypothetical protein